MSGRNKGMVDSLPHGIWLVGKVIGRKRTEVPAQNLGEKRIKTVYRVLVGDQVHTLTFWNAKDAMPINSEVAQLCTIRTWATKTGGSSFQFEALDGMNLDQIQPAENSPEQKVA